MVLPSASKAALFPHIIIQISGACMTTQIKQDQNLQNPCFKIYTSFSSLLTLITRSQDRALIAVIGNFGWTLVICVNVGHRFVSFSFQIDEIPLDIGV